MTFAQICIEVAPYAFLFVIFVGLVIYVSIYPAYDIPEIDP